MKNMRKGLVAAATALTVSFAGISVANAEETLNTDEQVTNDQLVTDVEENTDGTGDNDDTENTDPNTDDESGADVEPDADTDVEDDSLSSTSSDMEPKEIRDWIAVFTAIVGALGTLFAFINKM